MSTKKTVPVLFFYKSFIFQNKSFLDRSNNGFFNNQQPPKHQSVNVEKVSLFFKLQNKIKTLYREITHLHPRLQHRPDQSGL
jgi:hypothetical protein